LLSYFGADNSPITGSSILSTSDKSWRIYFRPRILEKSAFNSILTYNDNVFNIIIPYMYVVTYMTFDDLPKSQSMAKNRVIYIMKMKYHLLSPDDSDAVGSSTSHTPKDTPLALPVPFPLFNPPLGSLPGVTHPDAHPLEFDAIETLPLEFDAIETLPLGPHIDPIDFDTFDINSLDHHLPNPDTEIDMGIGSFEDQLNDLW